VEYFTSLCSRRANYVRWKREIKSRIAKAKAAINKKIHFNTKMDLNLRKKVGKCYICSTAFYGVETWTLQKVDQKYLKIIEMWY
jgi:hypothetical protein